MIVRILCLLAFALIFNSCHGQQTAKTEKEDTTPRTFEMVAVPSMITDPGERAKYLVSIIGINLILPIRRISICRILRNRHLPTIST